MIVLPPPQGTDQVDPFGPLDLARLIAASARARGAAAVAVARSRSLAPRVARARRRSLAARMASRTQARVALIEGEVDGRPVSAVVRRDGTVAGDTELLRRAHLVVALGDRFDGGSLPATLGGDPVAATLTLTRACDRVRAVRMALAGPPRRAPAPG